MGAIDANHAPSGLLERPEAIDVPLVLHRIGAVMVTVVLDDHPLDRIDEIAVQHEAAGGEDGQIDRRLGEPGVDEHETQQGLHRRIRPRPQ
ncbi:hypothetical protein LLS1_07610 [Leifsonia sp. LS1]|nr:hypothetical protein [Leifsonia sp. LS1]GIT79092.1 hypothetical protein LLS1_07610 [Leifsonia sp. LS1]